MTDDLSHKRAIAGRIGGLVRASRETNPKASGERGAKGLLARFERDVPAAVTDPAERTRLAELARRAYMTQLALKSAKIRARKRAAA